MSDPYYNFSDIPEMKNSLVAFLQILGFHKMMKDDHEGIILQKLHKTIQCIKSIDIPGNIEQVEAWSIKIFKGNIVYGQPITSNGEFALINTFFRLALFQLKLAMDGFFIRGGLSIGPHYMDDVIVYGPTMIDASNLENKQALVPRIILSDSAWELVNKQMESINKPEQSLESIFVLQDADNTYFLNYLAAAVVNYGNGNIAPKLIAIHKKQLIEKIQQSRNNLKVWSKYLWVANYHNYFCSLYPTLDTYKIDEKNLRLEPNKIIKDNQF